MIEATGGCPSVPAMRHNGFRAADLMRHAMGIAVFFGMLGVTFFGLLLTPAFYVALRQIEKRVTRQEAVHHHV
jgi:multidrug efflux pump subunit AcrB